MIPLDLVPRDERRPGVISMLCPSRRRPEMLTRSVQSLRVHATRPDLIELLVAYDPDDPQTKETADRVGADVIWEAPERYGHHGCAHYYAALLDRCHGEWMCPWNDDAFMQTAGWDDIIRQHPPSVIHNEDNSGSGCFPFVHLDLFHILGRFTDHPAIDTWYHEVGRDAQLAYRPGIYIHQERPDLGTGTAPDETWTEGRMVVRSSEFYHPSYTELRAEDVALLCAA